MPTVCASDSNEEAEDGVALRFLSLLQAFRGEKIYFVSLGSGSHKNLKIECKPLRCYKKHTQHIQIHHNGSIYRGGWGGG